MALPTSPLRQRLYDRSQIGQTEIDLLRLLQDLTLSPSLRDLFAACEIDEEETTGFGRAIGEGSLGECQLEEQM